MVGVVQASLTFPGNGNIYSSRLLASSKLFSPLQCVLGCEFLTSNGLILTREPSGAQVLRCFLVARHGKILLTPQNKTSLPIPSNKVLSEDEATKSDQAPSMLSQCPSRSPVPISLVNSVSLPGRTEAVVVVEVPKSAKDQLRMLVPTQNISLPAQLLVAYSVNRAEGRQVSLRIMKTSNYDITLQVGQQIGEHCPLVENCPLLLV